MTSPHDDTHALSGTIALEEGLRKYIVLILFYVDSINTRTTSMQKELSRLKYLLELKKAKRLSLNPVDGIDVTEFEAEKNDSKPKGKCTWGN